MLPIVGIPACARIGNGQIEHSAPARYAEALVECSGVLPVVIPPVGEAALQLLDGLNGLLLSGSPSNVHPSLYGVAEDLTPDCHDPLRDSTMLPMIRAAVQKGIPVFGICRGLQEMNVALGGALHQCVHDLPGRDDHRGGEGTREHRYRPKHTVRLSGVLAQIIGKTEITVNSVHGQGIDRPAPNIAVEAVAPDGGFEAIRVTDASTFAIGVQWHPEWLCSQNPDSLALFKAFGDACRAHASGLRNAA